MNDELLECWGCDATVLKENAESPDSGWGIVFVRGTKFDECPVCNEDEDDDL